MATLSPEQEIVFEKFKQGHNIFLSGSAGTGKTHLIKKFVEYLNMNNKKYQVCALTGTASLLLNCNARTIHSWAGIGIFNGPSSKVVSSVLNHKNKVRNWKKTKILIVDEVSMMSKKLFEILHDIAQGVHGSYSAFGGMQIVFTGDFGQLPPIETAGEPDTKAFCFESPIWNTVFTLENHIELKTIYRQTDPVYREILLEIRNGRISEKNINILQQYVNRPMDSEKIKNCIPTKIFPSRVKVDFINKQEYNKINEPEFVFECQKMTNCVHYYDSGVVIPIEYLRAAQKMTEEQKEYEITNLINNSNILQILRLKKGCAVMCTSNIDMESGICNGSQGVVIDILNTNTPVFRQSEDYPTIAIGQLPLMLAWSITIHKTQGATIDMGEIDVGNDIFEYGQTYVALSRIRSLDGLYLTGFNPMKIKANPKVQEFYNKFLDVMTTYKQEQEENAKQKTTQELVLEEFMYMDSPEPQPEDTTKKVFVLPSSTTTTPATTNTKLKVIKKKKGKPSPNDIFDHLFEE
jgi:ATP-dependent DNA helicase PIF1